MVEEKAARSVCSTQTAQTADGCGNQAAETRSQIGGGVEAIGGANGLHVVARGMGLMVKVSSQRFQADIQNGDSYKYWPGTEMLMTALTGM